MMLCSLIPEGRGTNNAFCSVGGRNQHNWSIAMIWIDLVWLCSILSTKSVVVSGCYGDMATKTMAEGQKWFRDTPLWLLLATGNQNSQHTPSLCWCGIFLCEEWCYLSPWPCSPVHLHPEPTHVTGLKKYEQAIFWSMFPCSPPWWRDTGAAGPFRQSHLFWCGVRGGTQIKWLWLAAVRKHLMPWWRGRH